jgi:hypothetical protein
VALMSASGHKRTSRRGPKSTFVRYGPKADKRRRGWVVRFVPEADIGHEGLQTEAINKNPGAMPGFCMRILQVRQLDMPHKLNL